ncbi:hypothetical protein RFI_18254 [Reticulomyxa filosa]|uniref:Uncharacterized protein n=1 Tax=Reticulomyxa filosa TaxID=46433 RepID=X6MYV8_RETFI|nr:hypothetical protein RFI_18254 [Reticulomyxa filosa]|eukprot:ETO18986.1 hypothetical protein RFI_18254 [Reticulomyxa filosa]
MAGTNSTDFITLEGISRDHIFKVENILEESSGVIEEQGYYFVVKQKKRRTAWHVSKEAKRNISKILTEKAEDAVHVMFRTFTANNGMMDIYLFPMFGLLAPSNTKKQKKKKKKKRGREKSITKIRIQIWSYIHYIQHKQYLQVNAGERAQELLNCALRYDDNNIHALNLYGKLLCAANLYDDALNVYARCLSIDPTNLEALTSRAMIYCRSSGDQRAPKFYEAEWHLKLAHKFHHDNVCVVHAFFYFF